MIRRPPAKRRPGVDAVRGGGRVGVVQAGLELARIAGQPGTQEELGQLLADRPRRPQVEGSRRGPAGPWGATAWGGVGARIGGERDRLRRIGGRLEALRPGRVPRLDRCVLLWRGGRGWGRRLRRLRSRDRGGGRPLFQGRPLSGAGAGLEGGLPRRRIPHRQRNLRPIHVGVGGFGTRTCPDSEPDQCRTQYQGQDAPHAVHPLTSLRGWPDPPRGRRSEPRGRGEPVQ